MIGCLFPDPSPNESFRPESSLLFNQDSGSLSSMITSRQYLSREPLFEDSGNARVVTEQPFG